MVSFPFPLCFWSLLALHLLFLSGSKQPVCLQFACVRAFATRRRSTLIEIVAFLCIAPNCWSASFTQVDFELRHDANNRGGLLGARETDWSILGAGRTLRQNQYECDTHLMHILWSKCRALTFLCWIWESMRFKWEFQYISGNNWII